MEFPRCALLILVQGRTPEMTIQFIRYLRKQYPTTNIGTQKTMVITWLATPVSLFIAFLPIYMNTLAQSRTADIRQFASAHK